MVRGEGLDAALFEHQEDLLWKGLAAGLDREAQVCRCLFGTLQHIARLHSTFTQLLLTCGEESIDLCLPPPPPPVLLL